MKDQLQLQEIAGYLPYGLHIEHNEGARLIICGAFKKYNADDFFTYSLLNWEKDVKSIDAKPILRPLSDLTKEITHNGETFVPLVEMYKIAKGCAKDRKVKYASVMATNQIMVEMEGHRNYFFGLYKSEGDVRLGEGLEFRMGYTDLIMENGHNEDVKFQNLLFQKLYEWNFDIHNLIDRGLAININDLPKAP